MTTKYRLPNGLVFEDRRTDTEKEVNPITGMSYIFQEDDGEVYGVWGATLPLVWQDAYSAWSLDDNDEYGESEYFSLSWYTTFMEEQDDPEESSRQSIVAVCNSARAASGFPMLEIVEE